jgi:hypothetical protein
MTDLFPGPANSIFEAYGLAMARWQYVETALYFIVHCVMGTTEEISSLVFFRIRSAETKIALANDMVLDRLPSARDNWNALRKRLKDDLEARNRFAHFEFHLDSNSGEAVLSELHHDIKARRKAKAIAYRKSHLEQAGREFLGIRTTLSRHASTGIAKRFGLQHRRRRQKQ